MLRFRIDGMRDPAFYRLVFLNPFSRALAVLFFAWVTAGTHAQGLLPDPAFTQPLIEDSFQYVVPSIWITAHPDGGVLVVTTAAYLNAQPVPSLFKLRRDGTIDPSFVAASFPGTPRIMHVYADGRVLVHDGGDQLVRLLPSGALDPAYTAVLVSDVFSIRVFPLRDGRFLISGRFPSPAGSRMAAFHDDGSWDPSFVVNDVSPSDLAQQADGKIIVAGSMVWPDGGRRRLTRLNLDGSIDPSFDMEVPTDQVSTIAVLPDGKILAANSQTVMRLQPNGAIDSSYHPNFGSSLGVITRVNATGTFYYLSSQPNAAGTGVDRVLRRLLPDGVVDPGFIVRGEALSSITPVSFPVSWDERTFYIHGGVTRERDARRQKITRVGATGEIDASFTPRLSARANTFDTVVRQADGKYLISGYFDYVNGVAPTENGMNSVRLNADGSLDLSYQVPPPRISYDGTAYPVVPLGVQPGGRILARGDGGLWRLEANGARDVNFPLLPADKVAIARDGSFVTLGVDGPGKLARFSADGVRDTGFDAGNVTSSGYLAIAPDGKVLVSTPSSVTRLMPDGRLDTSYTVAPGVSSSGYAYAMLADGGLLACAQLNTLNVSVRTARILHFDPNGRSTFVADVPCDLHKVAAVVADLVSTNGGGTLSLTLATSELNGQIHVQNNEVTLVSTRRALTSTLPPLSRFRAPAAGTTLASLAPSIFLQPANQTVRLGTFTSLSVQAYGQFDFTYQWFKDGVPFRAPQTSSGAGTLGLTNVQPADVGDYHVEVRNAHGVAVSAVARVSLLPPPVVLQEPPAAITVAPGQTLALSLNLSGNNLRVRWLRGNVLVYDDFEVGPGLHTAILPAVTAGDSGLYRATISNPGGAVTTQSVIVTVDPNAEPGRLINVSVRTEAGTRDQTLIVGYVIAGDARSSLPVLVRGAGPALEPFGVSNWLADPQISLRSDTVLVAENNDWAGDAEISSVAARVGAFPFLDPRSRDAALYQPTIAPGSYTVLISDALGGTGVALAEVYAAAQSSASTGARIVNLSSRARVSSGDNRDNPLIAGFVIAGQTAQTVLVRGIGPALAQFGVTGTLPRVELSLFDADGRKIIESSLYPREYSAISNRVGAFVIPENSAVNAAIVATLPPGAYTAQVRGPSGSDGIGLVEIYEVP